MVAGVAHEINTPVGIGVTAASHLVHLTEDIAASFENRTARKEDMEKYFAGAKQDGELILRNLYRTSELVKSFKMVSADQTSGEKRKFNMKAYLGDIVLSLRPRLQKTTHKVTINCPEDLEMDSYPGAFAQVITNLLINSLIHAFDDDDEGTIKMDVTTDSDGALLTYSDDGKGIAEENLKKVFDPFFTTNRGSGGTGLGLNIVSNIVNQTLKGRIICESKLGRGTTFLINLPIKVE
jgi:signal transduction histidine kinase